MEPIKNGSSIFRVKSITVDRLPIEGYDSCGYQYIVRYEDDPFSFTRCDVVEKYPARKTGEILTQSTSTFDKKGKGLDIVRIWGDV